MLIANLRGLLAAALFVAISSSVVVLAAAPKVDPKCPVSGHPCDPDATAAFEGGKICFCCEKCVKAFEADTAKFAAKARQQLVATGQFKQSGCPLSGGPVKAGTQLAVDGVEVGFCCNNCKGKVAQANADDQVKLVFGSDKGFTLAQ